MFSVRFFFSLIYSFLTVLLRANQNVTGLALTTFGVGIGNFFGGSLLNFFGESGSISLIETGKAYKSYLPIADKTGIFGQTFLSFGFLAYLAVIIALICSFVLNRTRVGLNLRAVGENPATADAAGINVTLYKYLSTCIGGAIAGLGGLYFVMGLYRRRVDKRRLRRPRMACNRNSHICHLETEIRHFKFLPVWRALHHLRLYSRPFQQCKRAY